MVGDDQKYTSGRQADRLSELIETMILKEDKDRPGKLSDRHRVSQKMEQWV